jgi:hypothetical protein
MLPLNSFKIKGLKIKENFFKVIPNRQQVADVLECVYMLKESF